MMTVIYKILIGILCCCVFLFSILAFVYKGGLVATLVFLGGILIIPSAPLAKALYEKISNHNFDQETHSLIAYFIFEAFFLFWVLTWAGLFFISLLILGFFHRVVGLF